MGSVGQEAAEGNNSVGWKRRKEILERRQRDNRDIKRSKGQITQPSDDGLNHSLVISFQCGDGNAGEALSSPDPTHAFVGLTFDAHAR